jgi:hypothetical protein
MAFEVSSLNAGLKTYILQQENPAYSAREEILKDLFRRYGKDADQYVIYEDLQGIDRSVDTGLCRDNIESLKELAASMPDKWKDCFTDTGYDRWWKFSVESALPAADWLSDLALIKVYVSLRDISKLSKVFCETVRLLLAYSDNRFHAKVSRVKRKDSMCFWVSRHAFHILESHFSECSDVIGGAMPFIAYRGRLGISRELATFDSHNSEQALLISSYFNSLEKEEDVSLSRMYDLLIKAWNQEISADHPVMKAFQYTRAQTVLILLDTMDVITGKTVLDNDHLFLQENGNIWRALGQASSWVQAERNYNALEEMESKLH